MNGVSSDQPNSPTLAEDMELIRASGTDACVLISVSGVALAETAARQIHAISPAPRGRFVTVDCTASPAALEANLFARLGTRSGRCTLFLKEIGQLTTEHQQRLLGCLLDATLDTWPSRVPARIIAFTSESLLDKVLNGTFDDRLFYRLNVIHMDLRRS